MTLSDIITIDESYISGEGWMTTLSVYDHIHTRQSLTDLETLHLLESVFNRLPLSNLGIDTSTVITLTLGFNTRTDDFQLLWHDTNGNGFFIEPEAECEQPYALHAAHMFFDWNRKFEADIQYIEQHANNSFNVNHYFLWQHFDALFQYLGSLTVRNIPYALSNTVEEWYHIAENISSIRLLCEQDIDRFWKYCQHIKGHPDTSLSEEGAIWHN